MKKFFYLSLAALTMLFSAVSCSDDDDPVMPPVNKTELQVVLEKLGEMENVEDFTKVLSEAKDINVGEEAITVFAVKNQEAAPDSNKDTEEGQEGGDTEVINAENIKRHIVKGTYDLANAPADSLILQSISGDPIAVYSKDGKIYVNGVLMEASPEEAGKSSIYVIESVIPEADIPALTENFTVYEGNEEWTEGAEEKAASENAKIKFFTMKEEGENITYTLIDSVMTDAEGKATLSHYTTEDLYYTVEKDGKTSLRDNYLLTGLFTTQEQIDNAPEYKTETALDDVKLGSLKVADLNGDDVIDENDKVNSGYLKVNPEAENTNSFIVSADYGAEEPEA
ncbi:hypothetical protein JGH11_14610 [Dysgonomonas sp. Marseille-P4677]|uniref:fasciclin domain-containing protein n=1 Tax=Dysgonomonas sp. Marseille-P4677 TaxID=2364790 RepID=UPI001911BF5F|nr:fasciclin domain-containing protein [Dysgonomonas sp. Marseille-P4677]MBK5722107.1 hypothetical protein [Dysgonomonas sp. Marseille-P4677]